MGVQEESMGVEEEFVFIIATLRSKEYKSAPKKT